jgi:hypothetical protein
MFGNLAHQQSFSGSQDMGALQCEHMAAAISVEPSYTLCVLPRRKKFKEAEFMQ